jgi:molybdopterin-guanine dinucleotide biosynthesis protein A
MPPEFNHENGKHHPSGPLPNATGVILAGGSSSRFGTNKALTVIDGLFLIEHIVNRLRPLFSSLLIVTSSPESYRFLGLPMTADRIKGAGPLAGIHAALSEITVPEAFITGCDMPLLDARLIRHLCSVVGDSDAAVPYPEGLPEPLYAVYNTSALPIIEALLSRGERSINRAIDALSVRRIDSEEILRLVPDFSTFANINNREDLLRLLERKRGHL